MLVQACLWAWKVWPCGFNLPAGTVKLVEGCLRARKSLDLVFTTVEALLSSCKRRYVGERPDKAVLTTEEVVRAAMFKCPEV